jgi:hypothetical protein
MPLGRSKKIRREWNGTHQLLVFADNVNLLDENIKYHTILLLWDASKEVDQGVNMENTGQSHNIEVANMHLKNAAKVKYLGTNLTNENYIHEEIKSRLNLVIACYHPVQNVLSFHL